MGKGEQTVVRASTAIITHLERQNRNLVAALRKLAIVQRHRMASGGGTVHVGWTCKVCDQDWSNGQSECHRASCVLAFAPTEAAQGDGG